MLGRSGRAVCAPVSAKDLIMTMAAPVLAEAADGLALAVINSSNAPILLLDEDLTVIAASESFGTAYQVGSTNMAGRNLAELGDGEWAVPQLHSLLKATAAGC